MPEIVPRGREQEGQALDWQGLPPPRAAAGALTVTGADPRIERIAQSRISVLIHGETGAGKEVLAQRVHQLSPRARRPMITMNCAAFCATLIESELFGHQRGAFTGADQARAGLIEAADGGTLFLDEVGDLPSDAQTKLLRVLETREVLRVGAVTPRAVDVRFIAATNVDLDAATANGRFREDLLYRLDGIRLHVPPLRARLDELLPAAVQFLQACFKGQREAVPVLTTAAEDCLRRHDWKGNFRELRNVMERAALMCSNGRIEPADLMLPDASKRAVGVPSLVAVPVGAAQFSVAGSAAPVGPPVLSSADGVPPYGPAGERERVVAALAACAGNQTRAARMLGISRRTLIARLETFGVARPRTRPLRVVAPASL